MRRSALPVPFKNNFRVTADVDIGNGTYTPAQVGTLDGDVTFKDSAARRTSPTTTCGP